MISFLGKKSRGVVGGGGGGGGGFIDGSLLL